jgi:hypothetical protein
MAKAAQRVGNPDVATPAISSAISKVLKPTLPRATRPQRRGCSGSWLDVRALFRRRSSPTNSGPTERRLAKLVFQDCMSKDYAPTIGPRTRASAASTTRTKGARLQIGKVGSALLFRPRGRLQCFLRATSHDPPLDASQVSEPGPSFLEQRDSGSGINRSLRNRNFPSQRVNVSMPIARILP